MCLSRLIVLGLFAAQLAIGPAQAAFHYCGPDEKWIKTHHKQFRYRHFWVDDHCWPPPRKNGSR